MPSLFISYSHEDMAIAQRVEAYFTRLGFEVFRDEGILAPGDQIAESINNYISKADGCILLLSQSSMESNWVKFEVNNALIQLVNRSQSSKFQIYPLVVEAEVSPQNFPQLASFMWGDITLPSQDEHWFSIIANRCFQQVGVNKKAPTPSRRDAASAELHRTPEYERLIRMMSGVFKDELEDLKESTKKINESILSRDHVLTPKMIAFKEKDVAHEIWVITKHLYNDVEDVDIRDSVALNLNKSIRYRYFVEDTELTRKRINEYKKFHFHESGADPSLVNFYILPNDFPMTSSEIVIYDPKDRQRYWGYFQVCYGKVNDVQAVDYFFQISDNDIVDLVHSFQLGIENGRYVQFEELANV